MTGTALAPASTPVPGYCTSGYGIHTAQQWQTCWNLGWHQPTTGVAHLGTATGHTIAPAAIIGLIIGLVIIIALIRRSRVGSPATSS